MCFLSVFPSDPRSLTHKLTIFSLLFSLSLGYINNIQITMQRYIITINIMGSLYLSHESSFSSSLFSPQLQTQISLLDKFICKRYTYIVMHTRNEYIWLHILLDILLENILYNELLPLYYNNRIGARIQKWKINVKRAKEAIEPPSGSFLKYNIKTSSPKHKQSYWCMYKILKPLW